MQRHVLEGSFRHRALFTMVVVGFLAYAALFIYRTSFVIDGERYFSLFDDAMIAMRYARNLANGYGLVWNPGGERIEGYTDPLWVLLMSLIHLLPIPQSKTSLTIQVAGMVFLALNLFVVRKIALSVSENSESVALGAVILTAFYLPINNWSLQGMEVSLLVLIMSLSVWQAIQCLDNRTFSFFPYVVLGLGTGLRPDVIVPYGGLMLFMAAADSLNRRRHLVWGSLLLLLFGGVQTLFRFWYFGDVFPNTYYLKLVGYPFIFRMSQGVYALVQFIWKFNVILFTVPFVVAVRRDRRIWLLLWVVVVQIMYSVYVGGDAWEYWGGSNRYIAIAMPEFFILLSYGLFLIARLMIDALNANAASIGLSAVTVRKYIFPLLIAYSVLSTNSIYGLNALTELFLITPPLHSGNGDENHEEVKQALLLRQITTPEATILVARAGTIPYFSDRYSIDLLGKNDRYLAHEPMRRMSSGLHRLIEFRPGHMKWDYDYSIGEQKPDVIVQLWEHGDQAKDYLRKYYRKMKLLDQCVYVKEGSANILWDKWPDERC